MEKGIKYGMIQIINRVHSVEHVNTNKDEQWQKKEKGSRDSDARWGGNRARIGENWVNCREIKAMCLIISTNRDSISIRKLTECNCFTLLVALFNSINFIHLNLIPSIQKGVKIKYLNSFNLGYACYRKSTSLKTNHPCTPQNRLLAESTQRCFLVFEEQQLFLSDVCQGSCSVFA